MASVIIDMNRTKLYFRHYLPGLVCAMHHGYEGILNKRWHNLDCRSCRNCCKTHHLQLVFRRAMHVGHY